MNISEKNSENQKTICFLNPTHFSAEMGGAEYQASLVLEAICKKKGYEIYYLCKHVASDFTAEGYHIRKVGGYKKLNLLGSYLDMFSFYSALKEIKPQIIYQNVGCLYTGVAALYAKKNTAKFIWHIASDDNIAPQWNNNIKRRIRTTIDRYLLDYGIRNADIIAGQTKYQNTLLKRKFGRECDTYIPIGHPFPDDLVDKNEKVTVLWIANLKPLKRPEVFVRLAKELDRESKARFVMIGRRGWGKWYTKLLADIDNLPNIEYRGELTQDEVNRQLDKSHILVNTSRWEGFSNTFVQAWMRKVPVVSLTVDPDNILMSERIGFRSDSFKKLCNDVRLLIESRVLREEMGNRASRYARQYHSVEKMVKNVTELF